MSGQPVSPATDLFALGVLLFELATGHLPWAGDSVMALAMARITDPPKDPRQLVPDMPEPLVRLITHCLQVPPERRPRSAEAVVEQLQLLTPAGSSGATPVALPRLIRDTGVPEPLNSPRVVILPFANIGDADDLAAGLAEDITGALMPHKRLRTVAARVARRFADEDREPAEIGRSLRVDYVVDGSVRRIPTGVRIQLTVTDCMRELVVLTRTIDCDQNRARHVHDEIAFTVACELAPNVTPVGTMPTAADPEVLRAFVAGRRLYQEAVAAFDPTGLRAAIGHFEEAAELAPEDPVVAAGLAIAVAGHLLVDAAIPAGALPAAQHYASRAVDLAPGSGEAWLARGLADMHAGHPVTAAKFLRRAIALAPSLPQPRLLLASLLVDGGWLSHARQQLEVALSLGGDVSAIYGELGRIAVLEGDTAARLRARRELDGLGLAPYAWWRGVYSGALASNQHAILLETYREMNVLPPDSLPPFVEALRVVLGSVLRETPPDAHLALLPTVGMNEGATPVRRCRTLMLWMALRAPECDVPWVMEKLRKAVDFGLCNLAWIDHAVAVDCVRGEPEFAALRAVVANRAAAILDAYRSDLDSQHASESASRRLSGAT